jgi:CRISPR/Cas system-associated exonuclease Cas4 (RecB family)
MQYRFNKIDKLGTYETSVYFLLGTVTHAVLEYIYSCRRNLRTPTSQEVKQYANDKWEEDKQKFLADRISKWDTEDYTDILINSKDRIDIYIDWYWDTYYPFDQAITDSVEKNISLEISNGIKFTGIIDRMDISGMVWPDDIPQNTVTIIDYKTNKSLPTNSDDSIYDQLNIYALSIKQKYGNKFSKIIGKVIYIHLQMEYTREITDQIIEDTRSKYAIDINNIEQNRFAYQMWDKNAFACKVWVHCENCPFQRICPARKHKFDGDLEVTNDKIWTTTIKHMIDKVWELSTAKKDNEDLRQEYIEALRLFVASNDYQKYIYGNEFKLEARSTESYKIKDQDWLMERLKSEGKLDEVTKLDIDKKLLANAIKNGSIKLTDYQDLISKEEGISIWWAKKIGDYTEE